MTPPASRRTISPQAPHRPSLSVITFNVHGARGKELDIEALAEQADVLGVCETWFKPNDVTPALQFSESVCVVQSHRGWRGQGGVALKIKPFIRYSLVYKQALETFQVLVIKIGDTHIALVYLTPSISKHDFHSCLNRIHSCTVGKTAIIGDLNCRNKRWDTKTNTQGKWLLEWAKNNKWNIHAPNEPTFAAHSGTSVVDLILSRGVVVEDTSVLHGPWDGCSDHFAVRANVIAHPANRLGVACIPQSQRSTPAYLKKAGAWYRTALSDFPSKVASCQSSEELEDVYEEFRNVALHPWLAARKHHPKRFRYFWDHYLEYLKRQRSKKYRLASSAKNEQAWTEYLALDRRIRTIVKARKRQYLRNQAEALRSATDRDGTKLVASILRKTASCSEANIAGNDGTLDIAKYADHLSTPAGKGHCPDIVSFTVSPAFVAQVANVIRRAKARKATGADELFVEAFKVSPLMFAEILCSIWQKCSELKYIVKAWRTATIVPIHKRGNKSDPSNYRPISLLSHGRQMISGAIGALIMRQHRFHCTQLGFRERTGTETAIVRHSYNLNQGFKYTAVLDLKSAYDLVPRELLMHRARDRLPKSTADMIALELQPMQIKVQGNDSETPAEIALGVPQGAKSSPPLYNLHMDTLAERLDAQQCSDISISMFADDVKVQGKTSDALQRALDICTEWAEDTRGTWSVRKCHVLVSKDVQGADKALDFQLAGQRLETVNSAEFLGVTITGDSIAPDKSISRVRAASQRVGLLQASGINRRRVPSSTLADLCRTFVYPVADYAMHLVPMDYGGQCELGKALEKLDYTAADFVLGCIKKVPARNGVQPSRTRGRLPRHLKLAKMPDWLQRVRLRLRSLDRRLRCRARMRDADELARTDPVRLQNVRETQRSPRDMSKKDVRLAWAGLCRGCSRKIPVPRIGVVPILKEPDSKVREAGIKWFSGSFPGNPVYLKIRLGEAVYQSTKSRLEAGMRLESWNGPVRKRTVDSIRLFLGALDGIPVGEKYTSPRGTKRNRNEEDVGRAQKRRC